MDRSRLKTFVILLLLIVNVSFLAILVTDRLAEQQRVRVENAQLISVLLGMGISLEYGIIPSEQPQEVLLLDLAFVQADLQDQTLTVDGMPVVGGGAGGAVVALERMPVWAYVTRYAAESQLGLRPALLLLATEFMEADEKQQIIAIEMGYHLFVQAELAQFRPVWLVRLRDELVMVDRQNGEITRIEEG